MSGTERTSLLSGHPAPGEPASASARAQRPLRAYLSKLPPSTCGLALGVCGLGVTWQAAAHYLLAADWLRIVADCISLVSFNVGCTALLLYGCKAAFAPCSVLKDVRSVSGNSVLPTFDMTLMIIGMWVYKHGLHSAGLAVWTVAVLIHIVLGLLFSKHVLAAVSSKQWDNVTPAWMIPPVGISLASGTGGDMGMHMGGWIDIFFWVGFCFFLVFFPATLYRATAYPIPPLERQEPLFAIFAAPSALLLSSWISLGGHQGHTLTQFLFLLEMLCIVLVALKVPRLAALPFSPEHAALTFPADIAAKACILYTHLYLIASGAMAVCSWIFLVLATVAVAVTLSRFCKAGLEALADPDALIVDAEDDSI